QREGVAAVGNEEVVYGRIEAVVLCRCAPSIIGRHICRSAAVVDGQRVGRADADWLTVRVSGNTADTPAAQREGVNAMGQPRVAFVEGKVINDRHLEIMCDVVLSDGLFQSTVPEIGGERTWPIAIGIGQDLGEDVGSLEGQVSRK